LFLISFWIFWASGAQAADVVRPLGLDEAFAAAVKRSETYAIQEREVAVAEEHYSQAKGNLLPTLSGSASYLIQDVPNDPFITQFFPRTQPDAHVSLHQPIFRGFREYAGLRQYRDLSRAQALTRDSARLDLYNDVAQSYYLVLAAEEELANLREQRGLYRDRVTELKARARAGTSAPTDLLTSEAAQASIESTIQAAIGTLNSLRESFAFLTGLPRETVLETGNYESIHPEVLGKYVARIENRPDVRSAIEQREAADEQVTIAKGGHLPSIDILGNYYFKRPEGVLNDIKWDVQGTLTLPIYSGGIVNSQVREAALKREESDLALSRLRRQADRDIRTNYSNLESDMATVDALKTSVSVSQKNYVEQKREYRRGLTRNLDVLQALTTAQESQRALVRARYSALGAWILLQTSSGIGPSGASP
jgi:outer membrane protein